MGARARLPSDQEIWAFQDNRIAVRFAYEWHDDSENWFRSFGNENWEFDEHGLMTWRHACIDDLPIGQDDRKYHWPLGRRPDESSQVEQFRILSHRPARSPLTFGCSPH